ncbi:hypothetical protein KPH14_012657 [Odynerus spinipes]|uniref:Integrase catalytic domain-containing protein n=1 Tax=Odynerus spinipes TaxID=1348599 RepID=A0AAD9RE27_9HYME|nr:hypothetical protein KPH14_012657 [Odynerus spinipes]
MANNNAPSQTPATNGGAHSAEGALARVGVRQTPFWKTRPELWFCTLESQFLLAGIVSDETKYHYTLQSLDEQSLAEVSDLVLKPPAQGKYEQLKDRLIAVYTDSEEKKLKTLLSEVQLGDRRPSQLLRQMRDLAQGKISDSVLKSLWLQRLPQQVQAILSVSISELDDLVKLADKIADVGCVSVNEVCSFPTAAPDVQQKLDALAEQINRLEARLSHQPHRGRSPHQRSKSTDRSKSPNNRLCYYHKRFGAPRIITTDQGSQFEAALFAALVKLVGARRCRTSAYHPESNGIIERWHRSLKVALMCHESSSWIDVLPIALLGLRTSYKEDIKGSPAEILYGTTLKVPSEFFDHEDLDSDPQIFLEDFRRIMRSLRPKPTAHHSTRKIFERADLYTCTHVFLRYDANKQPLQQPYTGPHRVVERISDRVFAIDQNGKIAHVTVERLKPAYTTIDLDIQPSNVPSQQTSSQTQCNIVPKTALKTYSRDTKTARSVHFV